MEKVQFIPFTSTTINAFHEMQNHTVDGMCVTDDNGCYIGDISVSDLKGITKDGQFFTRLYLPVHEFVKVMITEFPTLRGKPEDFTCNLDITLKEVLLKISANCIKRIYVIDKDKKPIGVITIADILHELMD